MSYRLAAGLALFLAAGTAAIPEAEAFGDWRMFNHDARGSRHNPWEFWLGPYTVGCLGVHWVFPTPGAVSGTPAVVGNRVYVGDLTGAFYSLHANDGDLAWSTQVASGISASALVTGNRVVFGDLAGNIYGLDRLTGAVAWQIRPNPHPEAQIYGSPTKVGPYVVLGVASREEYAAADPAYPCCSARGSVVMLDPDDGAVLWHTYTISDAEAASGASGASVWSTPTYDPELDLVYVTTGNNFTEPATLTSDAIIALDASTGAVAWVNQRWANDVWNYRYPMTDENPDFDFGDSAQVYTLPGGQRVVGAGQKSGFYHVVDAATGATVDQQQFVPGGPVGGLFADSAYAHGVVYANGSEWDFANPPVKGTLVAFTGDASTELWRFEVPGTANISGVAVANGVVYFESTNGNLYALDADTGAQLAAVPIGAYASGPSVAHGRVFAGTGDPFPYFFGGGGPGSVVALGL